MVSRNHIEVPCTRAVCRLRKADEQTVRVQTINPLDALRELGAARRRPLRMAGRRGALSLNRELKEFALRDLQVQIHINSVEDILQGHALRILSIERPGGQPGYSDANTLCGRVECLLSLRADGGAKFNITRVVC